MRLITLLATIFLLCVDCLAAPATEAPEDLHLLEGGEEPPLCSGLHESTIPLSLAPDRKPIDLGLFHLALDQTVTGIDSAYIHEVAELIIPSLVAILGAPNDLDTLHLSVVPGGGSMSKSHPYMTMPPLRHSLGVDDDGDGRTDEDPYDNFDNDGDTLIDEDLTYSRSWDSVFIHEMTHAFHLGLRLPSWVAEGIAEAAQYMVAEHAATRVSRGFRHRPTFDIAIDDLYNTGSAQIIGGSGDLWARFDVSWAYRTAGVSFILPCLAEIAAGRSFPHPLSRLKTALARQKSTGSDPSLFAAMDEAWSTPVDGVFPPSRWVRSRSVVNSVVRLGTFLNIVPVYPQTGLNPSRLAARFVHRVPARNPWSEGTSADYTYTGVHGTRAQVEGSSTVPDLAPGAYLVNATSITEEMEQATARTWILISSSGKRIYDGHEGIALIFIDRDGHPAEVSDLRVNGRVLEQVPGGAIVAPYSGLQPDGSLTVSSGNRHLGTITVPDQFTRVVTITVDAAKAVGPVSWSPHRVVPGSPLTVWIRKTETALNPASTAIDAVICDGVGTELVRLAMQESEAYDTWMVNLVVPAGETVLSLKFEDGTDEHGRCQQSDFGNWSFANRLPINQASVVSLAHVDRVDDVLILTFDRVVDPGILDLFYGRSPDGPWTPSTKAPTSTTLGGHVLQWELEPDLGSKRFVRVTAKIGEATTELFTDVLGRVLPENALTSVGVRPNPSPHEVAWQLQVDQPTEVVFEVFDLQGRRVFGPEPLLLQPGQREIRWRGFRQGSLGAGVYFLSATGGGSRSVAKVVMVRE